MNWIKEMMETQDQADDAKNLLIIVKENYLAEWRFMSYSRWSGLRSLPKDLDRLACLRNSYKDW